MSKPANCFLIDLCGRSPYWEACRMRQPSIYMRFYGEVESWAYDTSRDVSAWKKRCITSRLVFGAQCRVRIVTRFFHETVNANRYVQNLFNPHVDQLTEDGRLYGYFQQDGATARTALVRVHEVFGEERTISTSSATSWPPRSPDLSPCDFYLWGKLKSQVYSNNPHTLEELQQNIENAIAAIPQAELLRVSHNFMKRAQRCIDVNDQRLSRYHQPMHHAFLSRRVPMPYLWNVSVIPLSSTRVVKFPRKRECCALIRDSDPSLRI
ncbi:hypothetical protein ANN_04601 [Periplaneta americana]|uniref:Uncharacterized protein n=1 Tax=Periplaneta americana TaxID=6978 RepID=A0ABQ8TBB1_PERAM|nr:hypothetical protein ANN_04601 [Periplaneta americana]